MLKFTLRTLARRQGDLLHFELAFQWHVSTSTRRCHSVHAVWPILVRRYLGLPFSLHFHFFFFFHFFCYSLIHNLFLPSGFHAHVPPGAGEAAHSTLILISLVRSAQTATRPPLD